MPTSTDILGIHHITIVCANAQRTVDFYTQVLGQLKWKRRLVDMGISVDGPLDRHYFKSIYFNDPDGHIVALATVGPGFAVDEDVSALGQHLMLPSWLERDRDSIEQSLHPIHAASWQAPE